MSKGQLAILPVGDGRSAERRIVNLAARLREPGATIVDAEVRDLSIDGFMAETALALEPGAIVWLKLPGLEPQNSRVVWAEDGRVGCRILDAAPPADASKCWSRPVAGRRSRGISARSADQSFLPFAPVRRERGTAAPRPRGRFISSRDQARLNRKPGRGRRGPYGRHAE